MRIGLNTGPVVVGKIGDDLRMDYTAVGDTTNVAARLQQNARPGSVLVGASTHRLIAGYFETLDLGELSVKGHAPVLAFEVVRARGRKARLDVESERGLTPLVGRDREIATLVELFGRRPGGAGPGRVRRGRGGHRKVTPSARVPAPARGRGRADDVARGPLHLVRSIESAPAGRGSASRELRHRRVRRRARDHREGRARDAPPGRARAACPVRTVSSLRRSGRSRGHRDGRCAASKAHLRCGAGDVPSRRGPTAAGVRVRGSPLGRREHGGVSRRAHRQRGRDTHPHRRDVSSRLLASLRHAQLSDEDDAQSAVGSRRPRHGRPDARRGGAPRRGDEGAARQGRGRPAVRRGGHQDVPRPRHSRA